ncbi:MAG: anthranilate phosphoribosyltransferase [Longimicrobiaceae bacterium]
MSGAGAEELAELVRIAADRPLSAHEAERAFTGVMEGLATPVQLAALLMALRVRGATPAELAGGVRALRAVMIPVPVADGLPVVDTCGTGGGSVPTFNISTAAALLAAASGVRIAKHGNRSFTSRSGSADVLEALGVVLEHPPERLAEILDRAGIVFMFAPLHHPAMRHAAPVRRELGLATIFNLLGPLANPAGTRRQVVGVADAAHQQLVADGLRELGHERALVVHGEPGLDELSPLAATRVLELRGGEVSEWTFEPDSELGWPTYHASDLAGGEPAENAAIVTGVLGGKVKGAARAAVALNAAAAIYLAELAPTLAEAVALAEETLERGGGQQALERLREESSRTAHEPPVSSA